MTTTFLRSQSDGNETSTLEWNPKGFMTISSGYLVLLLQKHRQQVQDIHSSSKLSRKSPETRATYPILVLENNDNDNEH
ncbi:vomeronasal type-1 receptor 3-like [Sminthopsis crassicaudata]|uniref:vomeronasal type-1 receptor 3-like n=1 Tax=Sminthopsis crassicaudata TaxID=9301 RepID=UPI003D682FBA